MTEGWETVVLVVMGMASMIGDQSSESCQAAAAWQCFMAMLKLQSSMTMW